LTKNTSNFGASRNLLSSSLTGNTKRGERMTAEQLQCSMETMKVGIIKWNHCAKIRKDADRGHKLLSTSHQNALSHTAHRPGVHQLISPITDSRSTHLGWLTNLLADDLPLICVVFFDRSK
jgi:hypothetical protein